MATKKTAPGKDPRGAVVEEHQHLGSNAARRRVADLGDSKDGTPPADDPMVTVRIPRAFRLQVHKSDGSGTQIVQYQAGTDEMPQSHAEHTYSVANGVEIVKKGK